MHRITASAALAAFIGLSTAAADEKAPQAFDPTQAWAQMQQQMLQRFDANRDGRLSGQEQLLAQEAMRRHGINLGIAPGGSPAAEQFSKQFDRDGDGKLSPVESMAAQAAYQRMMGGSRSGARTGGSVQTGGFPAPGPALNPAAAAAAAAAAQKDDKVPPLIKRFDKDGDGKLNDAEKSAAQAELKKSKSKDRKGKDKKDAKDKPAPPKAAPGKGK